MIALANGRAIGYDDVGQGTPVLFLHGFPHNRSLWSPQLGALAAPARTIAMDLRGFGESPPASSYSMDEYADDAAALLDTLGVERAIVTGLSMGGYVALAFWRRHPHRVRGLVFCDTRATADTDEARAGRAAMQALAQEKGSPAVADRMIDGMIGKTTRAKHPELLDEMHRLMSIAPVPGVIGALDALANRPDSTATLATIDVPTLVLVGDEDVITPVRDAQRLRDGIAGSRLEVIQGAGHASNVERPGTFNHLLSEFVISLTAQ